MPDARRPPARTAGPRARRARKLVRLLRRSGHRRALRHGVAAAVEHEDVPLRDDVRLVLDVGASRGQFALFARARWPTARIVAFEPLPAAAERFVRVLGDAAELRRVALGAATGEAVLHVAGRDDSSSLLPIAGQAAAFPGTAEVDRVRVPVGRLADHLPDPAARPCLLKVDVQGGELDVLRGAGAALGRVDEVLCECSFVELYAGQPLADEVIAFLAGHGLRLAGCFDQRRDARGDALQADLLFRRAGP